MSTEKFLEQIAAHLLKVCGDNTLNTVIVLPSQRAAVYLRKYLSAQTTTVRFAPDMLTLDQFITRFSPLKPADRIDLLFQFYESYRSVWQEQAEPFDRFLKWAPMALKDFNDIDAYLLNSQQLFRDLTNLKELDEWSLNEENLTENQQQYAWFWKKLGALYFHFTDSLKAKGEAYQGLIFRAAAEEAEKVFEKMPYQQIFFCGFNALSNSEAHIIDFLKKNRGAEVIWDADRFYLDYPGHEAGYFLRKNLGRENSGSEQFISNHLINSAKNISIYAAPNEVAQCDLMAEILNKNPLPTDTAVVLANENLLPAVLNALPDSLQSINLTMGFKVRSSPLHSLFDLLFKLQSARNRKGDFHHQYLTRLFNHPYLNFNFEIASANQALLQKIIHNNLIYINIQTLSTLNDNVLLQPLFKAIDLSGTETSALLQMQQGVLQFVINSLQQRNDLSLEKEYLFHYLKVLRRIEQLVKTHTEHFTTSAYPRIFSALSMAENLSFVGEPLEGLQVMGMLETRTLDFKNLILLSCNEDVMPGGKIEQSMIPFELKKFYQLPTRSEHDAIYAYHFYRLLQRAENIHLIYSTGSDDWQNAEPSRYLAQIEHDFAGLKSVKINRLIGETIQNSPTVAPVKIEKTPEVLEQLKKLVENRLSPSALNAFVLCPLNFYYKYLIGFRDGDEVEETIEASTLGTVVHNVLEKIYTPFMNTGVLKIDSIESCRKNVRTLVEDEFAAVYATGNIDTGTNRLILEVAVNFVDRFLRIEILELKKLAEQNLYVTILALEKALERTVSIETAVGKIEVKIFGMADRIDRVGNTIRIIDYKTGAVKANQLNIKDPQSLVVDKNFSKALQLLTYAWLYQPMNETVDLLQAAIISFRNMNPFLNPAKWNGNEQLNVEVLQEFEKSLKAIIARLFDTRLEITHNAESEYCVFCQNAVEETENEA
jgi:ATP-dependent helicase/nuclease subunit B